ncbi:MAG: hypothetical protein HZB55_12560 [Deltaproteobacteria bacterium]|nr:hypothetical protein [Deltaproteobacteria bacterium]
MALLFTQDWDVIRGKEDEYDAFVAKTFIPRCNALGLIGVGGFFVQVGVGPRIVSLKRVESLSNLCTIVSSDDFRNLKNELKNYVSNYTSKVLEPTGRIQCSNYAIQKGVWKLNQYWDILPGMRDKYSDFITNTYLPTLENLDYLEVTGGWNVLIGGFSEIIAELTVKDAFDIGRLLDDETFRELNFKLQREYVTNYKSRILRTTPRFDEPRWFRL